MTMITQTDRVVSYDELSHIGIAALEAVGVPTADAQTTVDVLLDADLRGIDSHGIQRLLMYVPRLRQRLINPTPAIRVEEAGPVMRLVWGDDGLGQVVAARGTREAIALARQWGIGFVGCRDSHHFGAAAPFVQMTCDEKLIGIVGTNAFPSMAPWGGSSTVLGNNPFAVGVPNEGDAPFILDMALSVSSRGRIRAMAQAKQRIPEGWALDADGRPTTDPMAALKGIVLPVGGHKGYGLALVIDVLAGVLTGAGFGGGVKSIIQQWEEPQHVGHFMLVIDPVRFMPWMDFAVRMRELCDEMREVAPLDPQTPIVIPGEIEARIQEKRRQEGIPIPDGAFESLKGLTCGRYDYEMPKF